MAQDIFLPTFEEWKKYKKMGLDPFKEVNRKRNIKDAKAYLFLTIFATIISFLVILILLTK